MALRITSEVGMLASEAEAFQTLMGVTAMMKRTPYGVSASEVRSVGRGSRGVEAASSNEDAAHSDFSLLAVDGVTERADVCAGATRSP